MTNVSQKKPTSGVEIEMKKPVNSARERLSKELAVASPILFLSSGGSALQLLSPDILPKDCEHLTVGVVDERFGVSSENSNFAALSGSDFGRTLVGRGGKLLRPFPENSPDVESAGRFYDELLARRRKENRSERVVVTLGFGPDAHTAGIFPDGNEERFRKRFLSEKFAVGYQLPEEVDNPFRRRVTTTMTFLKREVDTAIVFAVGSEKKNVWETVGDMEKKSPAEFPAKILKNLKREFFFDW